MNSTRGKSGGFKLAIPKDKLLLSRVIEPFESSEFPKSCILGQPVCSDEDPCSAHKRWKQVAELMKQFFDTTTLEELMEREKPQRKRSVKESHKKEAIK